MSVDIAIRKMIESDCRDIDEQFIQQGWGSRREVLSNYLKEQEAKQRKVYVALFRGNVAGYVTVVPLAKEGPFKGKYPEIVDFNVFEKFQKQGVGKQLLDKAECSAKAFSTIITLGVGLHKGYGPAQRIYVKRGYVPDGSGVWFNNINCEMNEPCQNNDDLVLYLSKELS
ncbi:GNAT family N-acetyltransferase [Vagococcus sp. PNs007]|uniref:GNAT family N-acetyltransferase n=1 Tax=Vagococcus proximus TaxID=2991417 RepID=A0ABT5X1S0_9ENTE|nr:GNAT family N-acetyltransferase [Vagococcus proximus]MDF0479943.1 GNAT family N-acetyltransferase [Vagococcus proximus]